MTVQTVIPLAVGSYLTDETRLYRVVRSLASETMLEDCGNVPRGERFPCFTTAELLTKPWRHVTPDAG